MTFYDMITYDHTILKALKKYEYTFIMSKAHPQGK